MGAEGEESRYRVCVLGAGHVGKTSIVQRFLHDKFNERYRETVEELHCREYNVQGQSKGVRSVGNGLQELHCCEYNVQGQLKRGKECHC